MAHRLPFIVLVLVFSACGGRESGDPPATSGTSAGGGGTVAGGTGGSSGTGVTGVGGDNSAGQTGVGGAGQGGADWSSCTSSKDTCVLEAVGACGPGCEPVPISAFIGINSSSQEAYNKSHPPAPCVAIGCPSVGPGEANYPNYFASCESGQCQPVDVRTSPLSACSDSSECGLRSGTTCCGCGSGNLIAVSKKVNVEQAFCGPGGACAADCAVAPLPPDVSALCSAGHCIVHYSTADSGTR
jgi:hypothetical protein